MQVDYLVLSDAAVAADGKHYIHGAGWDTIWVSAFPAAHPLIAVAVRLRAPWNDTNQPHELLIDVLDDDGNSVVPNPPGAPRGTINVGRPPHIAPGSDQVVPLAISLQGLSFARAGTYSVVLRLDGADAARSPFSVTLAPGAQSPAP
jgi:hypothetical protein